ncbi:MAG: O-antigen ligase family protein [Elusimicrobiota bacterium]|nr:O-antigen ligase family protein [Elusimicrobiota bacterium]
MLKNKTGGVCRALQSDYFQSIIAFWFCAMSVLAACGFFLLTQDSAQVKIAVFQAGAIGVFALWLCKLFALRVNIFTIRNFKIFLPFILYFAYVLCSYFFRPQFLGRFNSFFNFLCGSLIFVVAAFESGELMIRRISSAVIIAGWISFSYGILQIANNTFLPGADIFFWTDMFGKRAFSTFANPNFFADFCLFSLMIITARFLQTRDKKLIVLLTLGLINIYFTESKGAWLALACGAVLFAAIYFGRFTRRAAAKGKIKSAIFVSIFALCLCLLSVFYAAGRIRSVNFRIITWKSALEMIRAKPLLGWGAGSFFINYAAYKKPQIFYIEGLHNIQTAHAENHYLEIAADLGLAGFALFLFVCFYLISALWRKFRKFDVETADERAGGEAYGRLAFGAALISIYIHNLVDISIYFVSSGFFVFLFSGFMLSSAYGPLDMPSRAVVGTPRKSGKLFFICAILASFVIFALAARVISDFAFMTSGYFRERPLMFLINWTVLIASVCAVCFIFAKVIFKCRRAATALILAAAAPLMYFAWGFMKAGNFEAIAGAFASRGDIKEAMINYNKAVKYNRFDSRLYRFMGIALARRMNMAKTNNPMEGDPKDELFNDYQRSQKSFQTASRLNPNEPLLYFDWGSMQREAARKLPPAEANVLYSSARANFEKALKFDPVFDGIYFQLANIDLAQSNPRGAYDWLLKYMSGPPGVEEEYVARHGENKTARESLAMLEKTLNMTSGNYLKEL